MAISFSNLGNYGRIGNQMFQYASLRGIANNLNYDWVVPPQENFLHTYHSTSNIFNCFKLEEARKNIKNIKFDNIWSEPNSNYFDPSIFYGCLDNTDLIGYLQSYKYFEKIEEIIKKEYEFLINENPIKLEKYISLHVRRGDYVGLEHILPTQNFEYYKEALENFDNTIPVVVCSDTIEWCKQQEIFSEERFIFSNFNPYEDLYIISQSSGIIMSNSTFAWWGAYLNENNNKVVMPKNWFGPGAPAHSPEEFLIKDWIMI